MSQLTALLSCLNQENTLVLEFTAALETETTLLLDRNAIKELQELTTRKTELAEQLTQLSQQRDALLAEMGLPAGHAGTNEAVGHSSELTASWETLLSNVDVAKEINSRNAMLIDISLRYAQESLETLRKITGVDNLGTYTAQGKGARPALGTNKPIIAS